MTSDQRIALIGFAVALIVGGGIFLIVSVVGDDADTASSAEPVEEATDESVTASPPPAEAPSRWETGAERAVSSYLAALAASDEAACRWITTEFLGRMARANENTYNNRGVWRVICESRADDLAGFEDLVLTTDMLTVEQASSSRAAVSATATLTDPDVPSYEAEAGATPREATVESAYHLVRSGGRWRINDIVEDWFGEYGGGELSDPLGTSENLVLIRGCEASGKRYCKPLIGD